MGTTVRVIKQFFLGSYCYSIREYINAPEHLVKFASDPKNKDYAYIVSDKKSKPQPKKVESKTAVVSELGGDSGDAIEAKELDYIPLDVYKSLKSLDQEQYILKIINTASRKQLEAYLHVSKAKVADLISDKLAE